MQYKKTAKSRPFQPVQAINYTNGMEAEEARQARSRQLNETIASENEQVNQKNLGRVGNIDDRLTRNLGALAEFSETLMETLTEQQKKVNEEEEARGLNEAFMDRMNGVPDPGAARFEMGEAALRAADEAIDETAIEISQQGAGFGPVQKLRQMSGWRAYGYAQGMAQLAGGEYGAYLEQQMMRDDLQFTDPTGASFTPMTATGSQRLQAVAQIRQNYIAERGLARLNPSLVSKYAFPKMMQSESSYNNAASRREAQNARDNAILEAKQIFDSDNDLPGLIRRIAAANGGNYGKAYDEAFDHLKSAILGDTINDLDSIKSQLDPRDGKFIGDTMKSRFGRLEAELASTNLKEWQTEQAQKQQAFDQAEREALDLINQDPTAINPTELEAIQSRLQELHPNGRRSTTIDTIIQKYGNSAANLDAQREKLTTLAATRTLTVNDVYESHYSLWNQFLPAAQQIEKQNKEAAPQKALASIEQMVRTKTRIVHPNQPLSPDGFIVSQRLQREFIKIRAQLLAAGESPITATEQALRRVEELFNNQDGPYRYDSQGFPKLIEEVNQGSNKSKAAFEALVERAEALRGAIGPGFLDSPGILLDQNQLTEMEANFNTPAWQPPPIIRFYAEALNKNPLEIINRLRGAYKMPPLEPQAYVEEKQLDPDVQQLLRQFPTPIRTARAWGQSGKFNEAIVPLQLGPMIAEKSAQYGVDPAIVAGIIEAENSGMDGSVNWRNDATSSAGAMGIAQFMPGTAAEMGVDPWDIESSIDGAARYVKQIQEQWAAQGVTLTPDQIAMMYNAGPNLRLEDYPYGQENRDYRTKFLRGFQKYGGGQGYWSSPSSMRQSFAEQQP